MTKTLRIQNLIGHSRPGKCNLQITSETETAGGSFTSTFLQPQDLDMKSYEVVFSTMIYPGQMIRARSWVKKII